MTTRAQKATDSGLVSDTIEKLRELVFAHEPQAYLGSMNDIARQLGVGIVTIQQATRILEHEGLLTIKRGPGGGYFGARPDDAALQRMLSTYMRAHNIDYRDAFEMIISLDCDLAEAAADSADAPLDERVSALLDKLDACDNAEACIQFEVDYRNTLFSIVDKPLLQLVAAVAMHQYQSARQATIFGDSVDLETWRSGRRNILNAVAQRDGELAFFEAQRFRRLVRRWMTFGSEA